MFHEAIIASLCRLCGLKAKEHKHLVSTIAKDIKSALALDVSEDKPDIHPWGVCDACCMKISWWKFNKTVKSKKDLAPPQIVTVQFKQHDAGCLICKDEQWNKELLLQLCKKRGLSAWISKEGHLVACVLHDLARTVWKSNNWK
ncbi:hypothetical protein HOLleu_03396 [Holothuria leucospilota]|uniref:Uncharacterized protein n=1 Tax=Holothuria leucospilota TaxID=206669 RepID=A0A9Q1HHL0_HOLLE|nr:hypothetical protein HOLleu_03396 [Holothuria leucospilota]